MGGSPDGRSLARSEPGLGRRVDGLAARRKGSVQLKIKFAELALRLLVSSLLLTAAAGPLLAYEETETQRNACKPDVYRWCKWYIPSRAGITYCLNQNIEKLSPACRAVMEGKLR